MLIATQLNFLSLQVLVALDPAAASRDRQWAELEIDESLRILPTPELVATVLDALEAHPRTGQQRWLYQTQSHQNQCDSPGERRDRSDPALRSSALLVRAPLAINLAGA